MTPHRSQNANPVSHRLAAVWQASAAPAEEEWVSRRWRERDRKAFLCMKKSTSVSTPCAPWNANIVRGRDTVASVIAWFVTHTHTQPTSVCACLRAMKSEECNLYPQRFPCVFSESVFDLSSIFPWRSQYVVCVPHDPSPLTLNLSLFLALSYKY